MNGENTFYCIYFVCHSNDSFIAYFFRQNGYPWLNLISKSILIRSTFSLVIFLNTILLHVNDMRNH